MTRPRPLSRAAPGSRMGSAWGARQRSTMWAPRNPPAGGAPWPARPAGTSLLAASPTITYAPTDRIRARSSSDSSTLRRGSTDQPPPARGLVGAGPRVGGGGGGAGAAARVAGWAPVLEPGRVAGRDLGPGDRAALDQPGEPEAGHVA